MYTTLKSPWRWISSSIASDVDTTSLTRSNWIWLSWRVGVKLNSLDADWPPFVCYDILGLLLFLPRKTIISNHVGCRWVPWVSIVRNFPKIANSLSAGHLQCWSLPTIVKLSKLGMVYRYAILFCCVWSCSVPSSRWPNQWIVGWTGNNRSYQPNHWSSRKWPEFPLLTR